MVPGNLIPLHSCTYLDPGVVTGKRLHQRGRLGGWSRLCSGTSARLLFCSGSSCVGGISVLPGLLALDPFLSLQNGQKLVSWQIHRVSNSQMAFCSRLKMCCVICCRNDSGDHSDHMHYYQVGFSSWGVLCQNPQVTGRVILNFLQQVTGKGYQKFHNFN